MSSYDKRPVAWTGPRSEVAAGWEEVAAALQPARVIVLEAYPGVLERDLDRLTRLLSPDLVVDTRGCLKTPGDIDRLVAPDLGDHPVFGCLTRLELEDYLDGERCARAREAVGAERGRVVVRGPGAALVCPDGVLVYAGMPRWEGQNRQRRGEVPNLGADNAGADPAAQYKRSFFCDWRVADRHRKRLWDRIDFMLDTTGGEPRMVSAAVYRRALRDVARRPFRVVPFFDPAPWGGHWIEEVCGVRHDGPNIGWCFDCVPEENSLLLGFGDVRFELPAVDLVYLEPLALLGEPVFGRFGDEFPIRFDFLDTMGGGNLSLQVHPLTAYIRERFGVPYTQDESYYLLDAAPDATVWLGLKEGIEPEDMLHDLRRAQEDPDFAFPADRYVNRFPAARHDHFLIPAGTVHCSGANAMVLEISATPYIFTFKLWDWGRLGLDGRPRPISLEHGERSIRWERDTTYAKTELINRVWEVDRGPGWVEERTGLHPAEFIETRRHRFSGPAPHPARDGVQVLNLVDGQAATVLSPDGAFPAFEVHYAETFVVPAAAGPYRVEPRGGPAATIKAFVRTNP